MNLVPTFSNAPFAPEANATARAGDAFANVFMKWVSKMTKAPDSTASDTRFRILIVAERLFAEIGFRKATVNDIARELRMSPANVDFTDRSRTSTRAL
jgi:hypothetical protein